MMKPPADASLVSRPRAPGLDTDRRPVSARRLAETLTRDVASGYIERIDREKKRIFLRVPRTGKLLDSAYSEEVEQVFVRNSNSLIQIVGSVEVDEEGNPSKILEIRGANEIDLRDINVMDVVPEYLTPKDDAPSLVITVDLTDDKQFYIARSRKLAMFKHAPTRAELINNVDSEMDFLWQQFALLDDASPCSEEVSKIRRTMRDMFREASR